MDTVFESPAQYLHLAVMRYYACTKGWFSKGSHWKNFPLEFCSYGATMGRVELNCLKSGLLTSSVTHSS